MNIFVSYTTRDNNVDKKLLERVSEVVSLYGHCYIDLLHNSEKDKQRHVEFMLSKSNLLILIASNSIFTSKWVQWELDEAKRCRIPIIMVEAKSDSSNILKNLKSILATNVYLLSNHRSEKIEDSPKKTQ
ncbi:TIR domain-containing protein [Klebsiella quasipneumoniae subsp. similipneumoniae]|uniref:TIR domain-containing protein n=1 Tax=Klebsiella quasipneumoniae TaxID=1463165 RepID=UPI0027E0E1DB|nr:TIR domain-containing protein [Klebsiella quasipneumoniae]MDQ5383594.1 TIR domain-containing protein [Klebsiella quasipneumoniae subsp. similipneumoniae]MDQ5437852.1 TIR domain-containing protein [Klebsiella quasipneumoniae subsp. similipneumoniae]